MCILVRTIDWQVRLVFLQTDNFRLFLRQQTDKQQNSVGSMSKRIKEKCLVFRFSFSIWNDSIYVYSIIIYLDDAISGCLLLLFGIYIYTENGTNKKRQFSFVCCRPKMETANFHLSVANGNGKRKFVLLGRQTKAVIDDFCFSKRATPRREPDVKA